MGKQQFDNTRASELEAQLRIQGVELKQVHAENAVLKQIMERIYQISVEASVGSPQEQLMSLLNIEKEINTLTYSKNINPVLEELKKMKESHKYLVQNLMKSGDKKLIELAISAMQMVNPSLKTNEENQNKN